MAQILVRDLTDSTVTALKRLAEARTAAPSFRK